MFACVQVYVRACVYSVCMFICVSTWISDKVYARSVCTEGRMFKHAQVCVKALKAAVGVLVGIYSQIRRDTWIYGYKINNSAWCYL